MGLVTIIIPAHNYGIYISFALESVLNQTYSNWECLVIDDGSTDNTESEVSKYLKLDTRFSYIHQQCKGVSAARNTGLSIAKGQYIQYLDADDLLLSKKLELQVDYLKQHPLVDIVYSESRYFANNDRSKLSYSMDMRNIEWMPKVDDTIGCALYYLVKGNLMPVQAPLSKMDLLKRVGPFDESMRYCEDWDYWFRCIALGGEVRFFDSSEAMSLIRVHKVSASNNVDAMQESWRSVTEKISRYIRYEDTLVNKSVLNGIVKDKSIELIKSNQYVKGLYLYATTVGKPSSGSISYKDIIYWLKKGCLGKSRFVTG